MTMKDLREQRSRLVADLRKITETPEGSDGDLPGDQAQRFDVLKAELEAVETRATHELELDLAGFLRGDPEARWKSHEIAVKNRVLTPNEVRVVEGWNPREGGDDFPEEAAHGPGT